MRAALCGATRRGTRAFRRALRARTTPEPAPPSPAAIPAYTGDARRLESGPAPAQRGACSALCVAVERAVRASSAAERSVETVRFENGETASVRVRVDGARLDVTIVASTALAAELGPRLPSLVARLAARGIRVGAIRLERGRPAEGAPMNHAPIPSPFEPRPVRSIHLPRVARRELDACRLIGNAYRAGRIREEIERAICDVVDAVLGAERRPALELVSGPDVARLATDDVAIEEASIAGGCAGFELRRGRATVRVIRTGAATVARCGWQLETGVAVALRDGDTVEAHGRAFHVVYEAPRPRPQVEIGPARLAERLHTPGLELRFALEPAGEPLVVACDGASARAVLDLVAGCCDRPYDRTALGGVERAVVEWFVHKAAHAAARAVAGTTVALRAGSPDDPEPDIWLAAAVRVGSYCGVWWLGTTLRALEALAPHLAERARPVLSGHPAIVGFDVTVVARVALGRLTPDELAGLEPGDVLVARGGPTRGADGLRGVARLGLDASREVAVSASVEQDGSTVRARLGGRAIDERSEVMDRMDGGSIPERPFEAALEELKVTVCVEVARRRMPLAELLALGTGDVVELHAAVQNDVTLTVDGGAFARAELVDADGALAVRIVALGGPR